MSSNERREKLLQILKKSDKPVKGSELSAELQVSRQVVVKDIALLRASGLEIIATSNGYIVLDSVKNEFKIKCKNHNSDDELYDELQTIIDLGGKVKDVIVEHPTYGVLKADLNVATNRDLRNFMQKAATNEFKQLSVLSPDYHIHTIEVDNDEIFEEIQKELKLKNILFE
ncbi:MAG: transcription repressor NadR [Clostridiales bacterium]|jgi:transcriptional regulator of NAD metabolism|uniref:transcription repressor NadR n=1 Tax=Clostridia TaxID=186801 RepID=UPI0018AB3989|nr:transcription repressor NadR [Clostridium sp. 1001270J_160509_D11]MDU1204052.1 transcription repressor NadR [Clostridiales bacterium]